MAENRRAKGGRHGIAMVRELFPRGLFQPEGSFRFSIDALLLARFCRPGNKRRILDLGCGCGVVGLSVLLASEKAEVTGVDIQPALVDAARKNAESLGLSGHYTALCADMGELFTEPALPEARPEAHPEVRPERGGPGVSGPPFSPSRPAIYDLALANPPYRRLTQGRLPQEESRRLALFGDENTLALFCDAAARALKTRGCFCVIMDASRLADLALALGNARLGMRKILPVYPKEGEPACLVLVEAQKNCANDSVLLPGLVLYGAAGLTAEALAFCPELACNSTP